MSDRPVATRRFSNDGPELFIALVYPAGTDSEMIDEAVRQGLSALDYDSTSIHLIERLVARPANRDEHKRYMNLMDAGNECRRSMKRPDALALFAANEIRRERKRLQRRQGQSTGRDERTPTVLQRHAFVLRSLKRPEEVQTLRAIYGDALLVLAAHSSPESRRERLTWRIARSETGGGSPDQYAWEAEQIIDRDHREYHDDEYGQRVSDTFPLADAYLDASHPERFKSSLERILHLLFGHPFRTPTRAEYGMFHAYGAQLRSADLSRQVGAAIADPDGEVIALGMNEVPKAGGGLYWEDGEEEDRRDFTQASDVSTEIKKTALAQLLSRLKKDFLASGANERLEEIWSLAQGTDLLSVGEFGRSVHAEMSAIVHAARRGIAIRGCTLYTTTFPCHTCARHIIAAGIARVVYNEPYPKSLARYLHLDSISVDSVSGQDRIPFEPYAGVSSVLYVALFKALTRKTRDGRIPAWTSAGSKPRRFGLPREYIVQEQSAGRAWGKFRRSPRWKEFLRKSRQPANASAGRSKLRATGRTARSKSSPRRKPATRALTRRSVGPRKQTSSSNRTA